MIPFSEMLPNSEKKSLTLSSENFSAGIFSTTMVVLVLSKLGRSDENSARPPLRFPVLPLRPPRSPRKLPLPRPLPLSLPRKVSKEAGRGTLIADVGEVSSPGIKDEFVGSYSVRVLAHDRHATVVTTRVVVH